MTDNLILTAVRISNTNLNLLTATATLKTARKTLVSTESAIKAFNKNAVKIGMNTLALDDSPVWVDASETIATCEKDIERLKDVKKALVSSIDRKAPSKDSLSDFKCIIEKGKDLGDVSNNYSLIVNNGHLAEICKETLKLDVACFRIAEKYATRNNDGHYEIKE